MAPQDSNLHRISPVAQGWPSRTNKTQCLWNIRDLKDNGYSIDNGYLTMGTLGSLLTKWELSKKKGTSPFGNSKTPNLPYQLDFLATFQLVTPRASHGVQRNEQNLGVFFLGGKSTVPGAWLQGDQHGVLKGVTHPENHRFSMGNYMYLFKWWMFECHVSFLGGYVYMLWGNLNQMWRKGNLTTCCDVPHLVFTGMCLILPSSFWSQLTSDHTTIMLPYSWTAVTSNKFNTLAYNQTP